MRAMERIGILVGIFAFLMASIYGFWTSTTELGIEWVGVVGLILGGLFVLETLSVMLQVSYFKYTKKKFGEGRRILRMAPLHHHFEQTGWKETQVVVRFWIITIMLVLVGLSSLKLR